MDYTVGFTFDGLLNNVLLIRKTKPSWQKSLLNGVGGKQETYETERSCMSREFQEETGVDVPKHRWINFGELKIPGGSVYLYYTVDQFAYDHALTTTEEEIVRVHVSSVCSHPCVSNLTWLIPAALDHYKCNNFRLEVTY